MVNFYFYYFLLCLNVGKVKCWLGSKSGYVNLNVNASTRSGAEEQLRRTYGAEQIINLREVRGDSSGGGLGDISTSSGGVAIVAILALFVFFAPWVMMMIYGAGSAWIAEKVLGISIQDYIEDDKPTEKETKKSHGSIPDLSYLWGNWIRSRKFLAK